MIEQLLNSIEQELDLLKSKMNKEISNTDLAKKQLPSRLNFLKWVNLSWKLRNNTMPKVVKQKEIFYCQLGENIGSEQNGKRPVVIIQNNIGNSMGNTTIIVPITSYEHSSFFIKDNKQYMSYIGSDGTKMERILDFYEIPISTTSDSKQQIYGIANVVHLREVSKKRLSSTPVAKITDETYSLVVAAITKNISIIG